MDESQKKRQKRPWWRSRVLIVIGVFVVLIVSVRIWWGGRSGSALRRELDAIAARGEPILWADLAPEPIPDEENAAELYKAAVRIATPAIEQFDEALRGPERPPSPAEAIGLGDLIFDRDLRRAHAAQVGQLLADCQEALALARRARGLKQSYWKLDYKGPAIQVLLPSLIEFRTLGKLLCLAAASAHDAGDDAAAVEYLRDVPPLGRSVAAAPILISYLVGIAIDSVACSAVEELAPTLQAGAPAPAVRPEQVRQLIDELLAGEQGVGESLVRAFIGERAAQYDTFERLARGDMRLDAVADVRNPKPSFLAGTAMLVFRPLLTADTAWMLRHMSRYVEAARQQTYPGLVRARPKYEHPESVLKRIGHLVSSMLMPTLDRMGELHFRSISMRRMTAVALAIRLYQLDHAGRRPEKLAELVGKYLPAVPKDPFADDGRAVAYLPAGSPPLLYTLGTNGTDEGGEFRLRKDGGIDQDDSGDHVFFLNGDRPRRQPTTRPAWRRLPPAPGER